MFGRGQLVDASLGIDLDSDESVGLIVASNVHSDMRFDLSILIQALGSEDGLVLEQGALVFPVIALAVEENSSHGFFFLVVKAHSVNLVAVAVASLDLNHRTLQLSREGNRPFAVWEGGFPCAELPGHGLQGADKALRIGSCRANPWQYDKQQGPGEGPEVVTDIIVHSHIDNHDLWVPTAPKKNSPKMLGGR